MWRALRKRIILIAPLAFCTFMLIDWVKISHRGDVYDWGVALVSAGVNIIWTVLFTAISLFLLGSLGRRLNSTDDGAPPQGLHRSKGAVGEGKEGARQCL
jgi:hypothetical protein